MPDRPGSRWPRPRSCGSRPSSPPPSAAPPGPVAERNDRRRSAIGRRRQPGRQAGRRLRRGGGTGLGGSGMGNTGNSGGVGTRTGNPGYTGSPVTNRNPGGNVGGGNPNPNLINRNPTDPRNARGILLPRMPETVATNQMVLYALASGTGGFVIANTNDLAGGLEKISKEQNEYYLLGYSAPESAEGSCHTIQRQGEPRRNEPARAHRLLQREERGPAGRQAGGERAGGPAGWRSAGHPSRRPHPGAVFLHLRQHRARQCRSRYADGPGEIREGQGQAARRVERAGHRLPAQRQRGRALQRHRQARLRREKGSRRVCQEALPL